MSPKFRLINIFKPDYQNYDGVRRINIYLMRLIFLLTFLFVGMESWSYILTRSGSWDPVKAVAFCVWAAYSLLSVIGLYNTLKMIPLMLLIIFYKALWLILVALPLWQAGKLTGSVLEMTYSFMWITLAAAAVPWGYVFRNYILKKRKNNI